MCVIGGIKQFLPVYFLTCLCKNAYCLYLWLNFKTGYELGEE